MQPAAKVWGYSMCDPTLHNEDPPRQHDHEWVCFVIESSLIYIFSKHLNVYASKLTL